MRTNRTFACGCAFCVRGLSQTFSMSAMCCDAAPKADLCANCNEKLVPDDREKRTSEREKFAVVSGPQRTLGKFSKIRGRSGNQIFVLRQRCASCSSRVASWNRGRNQSAYRNIKTHAVVSKSGSSRSGPRGCPAIAPKYHLPLSNPIRAPSG